MQEEEEEKQDGGSKQMVRTATYAGFNTCQIESTVTQHDATV